MKRLVITGSSGYLGRKLVRHFRKQGVVVMGTDVKAPTRLKPNEFVEADIRDDALGEHIKKFAPDSIIHGAFVFQPMRDSHQMSDINIGGTENILKIADDLDFERLLLISSATAYGAWPDNPVPIYEDWPLRPRTQYQYAADKTEVERLIRDFSDRCPDRVVSWVRPAVIAGPGMRNYISRWLFGMPFLAKLDGVNSQLQFVHEDDVVAAIDAVLTANMKGPVNIAPPNWTSLAEIAKVTGRRMIWMPFFVAWIVWSTCWNLRLRICESPPGLLYLARYPWVISPDRLTAETGYEFRHTSTEAILATAGISPDDAN